MESRHLIIGGGEIGQSMWEVLNEGGVDVLIRDRESDIVGQFNYLHIAFGCETKAAFIRAVQLYDEMYQPHTIIIHSTIDLGTTRALGEKAVHVPIRGRHPHLEEGMKTFTLYVGGNDSDRVRDVANLYRSLNIDVFQLDPNAYPPETTESLKLWCTTYLAWNLLFEKEMHRFCKEHNVPFEVVYEHLNQTYNEGYTKLGEPQFTRPILKHTPGKIGGHCQIPNSKLLEHTSYIPKLILEMNESYENPDSKYFEL
jgi:hypothetical protein